MNNTRHTFKKNNTKEKTDFILKMSEIANNIFSEEEQLKKIFDIIDYYALNSGKNSFLTIQRVLNYIFEDKDIMNNYLNNDDKQGLIELINSKLVQDNKTEDLFKTSSDINDLERLNNIISEFKQIQEQADEMRGNSVKIANNINIVNIGDDNQAISMDSIDEVELIDLGDEMDNDNLLETDTDLKQDNTNIHCIYCGKKGVIILSSNEGYCPKCEKSFFIINNKK